MDNWRTVVRSLLRAVSGNRLALLGAAVTLVLFPLLLAWTAGDALGWIDAPRLSLVVYGGGTALFLAGHLLLFLGLFVFPGRSARTLYADPVLKGAVGSPAGVPVIRALLLLLTVLSLFNGALLGAAAYNGYRFSDSVAFCARTCHEVMTPERTAYAHSPHSHVSCTACHIGPGAGWFVRSKLSGARQLAAVTFASYHRPIPTPIAGLRPARETCESCHRPDLFRGDRVRVLDRFLEDEGNTHLRTVLHMHIGSGGMEGRPPSGAHAHMDAGRAVVYRAAAPDRLAIGEVRLARGGTETVFRHAATPAGEPARQMDCLDCHNRPTHIYAGPEEALDARLRDGRIPRSLPWIRKLGRELITLEYASREGAERAIVREVRSFYDGRYPGSDPAAVDAAAAAVASAYTDNVFPEMRVGFGTYPRHLGHRNGGGCFRCHDGNHTSPSGAAIPGRCDLCHDILERDRVVEDAGALTAG